MRVSLQWLREYIDLPTEEPDQLTEAFSSLGMQVESIIELPLPFEGVVVGRVDEVRPHPDAERLRVCAVSSGDRVHEVVCGAWNFATKALVPLAVPGSVLAGGTAVAVRTIRGVTSNGMICSARELGLGDDAEGILVLQGGFEVGDDLGSKLPYPDHVFDLEIESNRPDEMSMVGVARELGAYYRIEHRGPEVDLERTGPAVDVRVTIEDTHGCWRFVAVPLDEVQVGPSPLELQLRLQASGIRPINNVVDVTNYVMLELGQPLHAFDWDRIAGGHLVVRRASEGERLRTLDGNDRILSEEDLIIADSEGVTSLAGVMGGEGSEVRQESTRVLLEAAHWDPPTILEASGRHGLRSEASARFSRGVDPNLPPVAAHRAAQLLQSSGAGRISQTEIDHVTRPSQPWDVELPLGELTRLLGVAIDGSTASDLLERLGMRIRGDDPLVVTVPTWRLDVTRSADLVEEVARLRGYDTFPETVPLGGGGGLTLGQARARMLREIMVGAGFSEAQTLSFMSPSDLDRLGVPPGDARRRSVALKNPISAAQGLLRTTMLPALLEAAARNVAAGLEDVALFEVGRVVHSPPSKEDPRIPTQPRTLAYVAVGVLGPRRLGAEMAKVDVHVATGVWRLIADAMGLGSASVRPAKIGGLHPGRSAELMLSGEPIGFAGELHPSAARAFGLTGRVAVGEVMVDPLVADPGPRSFREPGPFPPVVFDLAFEVDRDLPAATLLDVVRAAAGPMLESAGVFDEFTGLGLSPGRKSLAVRVVLRARDRTLTQEEAGPIRVGIASAVKEGLGGRLRGEL